MLSHNLSYFIVAFTVVELYFEFEFKLALLTVKGALDKYNIYLLISNSILDLKLNQYQNFQLILPMRFHFMRYFMYSIIPRVSHRLLYCVFIEVNFEK